MLERPARTSCARLVAVADHLLLSVTGLALACAAPREPGPAAARPATAPPTAPPVAGPSARAPVARSLAVTYLANEGLLLAAAGEAVLIDGLHRPYQPEYAVLGPDARALVERAADEYAAVRLVLVSHHHRDHFDAEAVRDHLLHNVRSRLISSPQVVDAVLAAPGAEGLRARCEALPWAPGVRHRRRVDSVTVEFIGMSHGEGRHRDVQNFGHIVELGGRRVLHVGDAELSHPTFPGSALAEQPLDGAYLPFWYFLSASDRLRLRPLLGDARRFAVHLPPNDASAAAELARVAPEVRPLLTAFADASP